MMGTLISTGQCVHCLSVVTVDTLPSLEAFEAFEHTGLCAECQSVL
jgi:hypothetical protein